LGAGLAAWAQKPVVPAFAGGTVNVDKDGHVLWNGKPADSKEALAAQARNQVASGIPSIRLSADAKAEYSKVEPVIEWAQKAGMRDITLMPTGVVLVTPTPPPPGTPPPPKDLPQPVRIHVDFDGSIFRNGTFVDEPSLDRNLKGSASVKWPPEMHIEPHQLAPFGRVEEVLAAIKKAGLTKAALRGGGPVGSADMILGEIR
jgi:biopolymer transport protein ExbD